MTRTLPLLILLTALSSASQAIASPQTLALTPANTQAMLHAKSAVTDVDGTFQTVSGSLKYDLDKQTCHVDLTMDVSSLKVGSAVLKTLMLSGVMLDSDAHPTMHFVGDCHPKIIKGLLHTQLVGSLTMKGQTHPVIFETEMQFKGNTLHQIASNATFDQRKWGLSTLLHSIDPMVRAETVISLH